MAIAVPFTGGCACGAIRYECSAEPVMNVICHCRDCQRASGSAFCPSINVAMDALIVAGGVKYYEVRGGRLSVEGSVQNAARRSW